MPSQYLLSFAIPISCYKAFRNDDDGVRDADVIDSRREIRKVTLVNVFATSQGVGWAPNRIWWNRSCAIGFFFSFFFSLGPNELDDLYNVRIMQNIGRERAVQSRALCRLIKQCRTHSELQTSVQQCNYMGASGDLT